MNSQNYLPAFNEIVELIERSRQTALRAVNTNLIKLYWQVGAYISNKLAGFYTAKSLPDAPIF